VKHYEGWDYLTLSIAKTETGTAKMTVNLSVDQADELINNLIEAKELALEQS
jgi:hypothetical protein